jgi:hypothetical protein
VYRRFSAIFDPPRLGWSETRLGVTALVAAYALSAAAAQFAASQMGISSDNSAAKARIFTARNDWRWIACLLLVLAVNRYFGVLLRLVTVVRHAARASGWYYTHRRIIQAVLTTLLAVAALVAGLTFARTAATGTHPDLVASAAAMFLLLFTIVRGVSLHEVDQFLYRRNPAIANLRPNLVLEWASLALITAAAITAIAAG